MSRQIRRVATLMLVLFGVLFVNLNVLQLLRADELANNPNNRRLLIREYEIQRGPIVAGDETIARSVATDGALKYEREYPSPRLYAHVTGYYSFVLARSGLEAVLNETLTGTPTEVLAQNLAELIGDRDRQGNTVEVTIVPEIQRAAAQALGDRVGAVVAIDPGTGAVLAQVSSPSYDPNPLSGEDTTQILEAWESYKALEDRPLLNRTIRELYFPGSAFKLVTAAAAIERGIPPSTAFEDEAQYQPPVGRPVRNYQGGPCRDGSTIDMVEAMVVSCNAVFARLGVQLGDDALIQQAERFGFNRIPPLELPPVRSVVEKEMDEAVVAQTGIGQRGVKATALQMAMVVGAIVNDGQLMRPHLVRAVRDPSGRLLRGETIAAWDEGRFDAQAISPQTARQLREMMVQVVQRGTGTAAAIPDVEVGGKTGTAQDESAATATAWFVGYAEDRIAVAVVVPDAGGEGGGSVAAPIAKAVMQAAVSLGGGG